MTDHRRTRMTRRPIAVDAVQAAPDLLPGLSDSASFEGDRQFSMNLSRGLQMLRAFTVDDTSLSHRDLCARSGLPKATVSRLIYTLTMLGYLTRTPDQRYTLGAGVLLLGYPMLAGMKIRQIARPWLEQLARETGGSANLGMRDRLDVVYVDSSRADRSNATAPDIGSTRPLLLCAIGRALLIGSPQREQTAILNRLRVADPERYKVERLLWERDRDGFARRGWCWSVGDWRPEIQAVAMPIRQTLHPEPVALNCTWTVVPGRRAKEPTAIAALLKEAVRRIEQACREGR